jgi:autotransporter-associated beta strand protein
MPVKLKKPAITAAAIGLVKIGALSRGVASAQTNQVEIGAQQDATLLGGYDAATNNSLADPGIFVGTDGDDNPKRGLIEFNIAAAVPTGATITGVQLQLTVGQVAGSGGGGPGGTDGPETISLYDESQAWGQPTNFAGATSFGGTGHGAAPDPGDATWNYAFYDTIPWTIAGGDWTSSLPDLADASVTGTLASFTWSSAAMVTDVQNWLNNPNANFGWIIKNADETDPRTFRAFWSAQGAAANDDPALAPQLSVTYVAGSPVTAFWSGAQSGAAGLVWSTELGSSGSPGTNWSATDGGADLHEIPGGGITNVIFGATGNGSGNLSTTLGADFSINSLTFTSARTNSVIIGGANSLTILSGGITVQPGSGAHTIDATGDATAGTPGVVLGASQTWTNNSSNALTVQSSIGDAGAGYALTIAGSGIIQLAGANTYTGGTIVTSGRLLIEPTGPTTSALPTGKLSISGGTVQLAANVTAGAALAASNVNLTSLSITGNGTLDIGNNHIIINYGGGADPIASIVAWIAEGAYSGGTTITWTGTGITSSAAQSNPNYGIGYADAAAPGNPANLSAGQIEIMYTLLGDANLDGKVNGTDFNLMATNFNQAVTDGWDEGDFNYDGKVNGNDFVLLADNFNQFASQSAVSAADLAALDSFAAQNDINVPEPVGVSSIAILTANLLCRRRKRPG